MQNSQKNEPRKKKVKSLTKSLTLTGLRVVSQGLVLLAIIAAYVHYDKGRTWDKVSVAKPEQAIHLQINDTTDLLVDPSYYKTNVSYGRIKADDYERKIAHRVWMLPMTEGYTEFWSKHNGEDAPDRPDSDDYMVRDVIEDLWVMLLISLIWISVTIVFGVVEGLADAANVSSIDNSIWRYVWRSVYYFFKALQSQDGSDELEKSLAELGMPGVISLVLRGIALIVREGFLVFVTSVSVVYAFVVLFSFQGPCASDVELPGRCSVQRTPVPTLHFVLLLVLSIVGRIASGYNYSDGSWGNKLHTMIDSFKSAGNPDGNTDQMSQTQWSDALSKIIPVLTSTTVQMFSCAVSVVCSLVIILVMSSAYYSIGEDRRFPYEAIYITVVTLESLFIALNALVLILSQTRFIQRLSNLKFYIEGRLFGALFISAVTLSIYMSLRRGINMHGTLSTQSDTVSFGHYGGSGGATVDSLHGLTTTEFDQMQLTFAGAFHGKQLSAHDEHCHYVPKSVFENPEDYSYNQTLCAHGHIGSLYGTCCMLTEFESSGSNGTTVYTGLWVILAGIALQVLILSVSAAVTRGALNKVVDTVSDVLSTSVETGEASLNEQHIPRGFKTIRVV